MSLREKTLSPLLCALLVLAGCWLTAAAVLTTSSNAGTDDARARQFGQGAADQLAALAAQPLMTQDALVLSALAQRLALTADIRFVAITTLDGTALASAGTQPADNALQFDQVISIDGARAGIASVGLAEERFKQPIATHIVALAVLLPIALAALVLLPMGWFASNVRFGRRLEDQIELAVIPESAGLGSRQYVLVANLFNQISLDTDDRSVHLSDALWQAEQVADLYGGQATALPGTGVLLTFSGYTHSDRCFEIICAAILLAEMFARANGQFIEDSEPSELLYRFGLHKVDLDGTEEGNPLDVVADHDAVADAVLLSATARNSTLVVSEDVFFDLDRVERLLFEERRNPALGAMSTAGAHCYLVHGVTDSYQVLLERQAELLLSQSLVDNSGSF
ncbi:MAG: hypothetical protein NXH85_08935 [Pseudomonadaceae bacterium]|nr:hypothetical protein [Pseudomonadaceae bacterium]